MYGAILGDIIGSPFEFDRGTKTKDFELFTKGCQFTDDSVMTAAIAEALMAVGPDATKEEIEEAVTANMQDWGKRYPHAGLYISNKLTSSHGQSDHLSRRFRSLISERYSR